MEKNKGGITVLTILLIIIGIIIVVGAIFVISKMTKTQNEVNQSSISTNKNDNTSNRNIQLGEGYTTIIDDETVLLGMKAPKKAYRLSYGWSDKKNERSEVEKEGYMIDIAFVIKEDLSKNDKITSSIFRVIADQITFNESISNILVTKLSWVFREFEVNDANEKQGFSIIIDKELAQKANINRVEDIQQLSFNIQMGQIGYTKEVVCKFNGNNIESTVK